MMTIIVKGGWHNFALDEKNLNIVSVYPNATQKYAMLYRVGTASNPNNKCIVEIWEYGFKQLTTKDVECTVYYI